MDYKVLPFVKEDLQENGIIKGYGSTFGGKPDSYGDIIAHGAFAESIVKKGRGGMGISMLYQHSADKPLGVWDTIYEDSKGLKMEGRLAMKTQLGMESYELMKLGALKGLSIGFDIPRTKDGKVDPSSYEIDSKKNTRLLKKINLWEVSPVTFAANTRASITGVKGLKEAKTVRELERLLRDSGLSKSEAVYLASMCKSGLRDSGADDQVSEILDTLNRTISEMKIDPISDILNTLNFVSRSFNN
jgi:HK97 family phage prohead protease